MFPRKIAAIIKNREKRSQIEPYTTSPHVMLKYCNMIIRPDFVGPMFLAVNMEEFLCVLKDFYNQKSIINELRELNPIFFDEPSLDTNAFLNTYIKWRASTTELCRLQSGNSDEQS